MRKGRETEQSVQGAHDGRPPAGQQVPLLDVRVRLETLRRIVGVSLHKLGSGSGFLDVTRKARAARERRDRLDLIKM